MVVVVAAIVTMAYSTVDIPDRTGEAGREQHGQDRDQWGASHPERLQRAYLCGQLSDPVGIPPRRPVCSNGQGGGWEDDGC